ncbi:Uma2 family endonuclease [Cyanobacteria bacterium FACHB-63]|nr:Uma2 family endonuclease [Cyanobacteria bacterium FACHB-63]
MTQTPLKTTTPDQHIVVPGTWEQFKSIQKGFEHSRGVRLFYYDGTIELLMPGRDHEIFGHVIGYLVTTYLIHQGIFFQPTGAMTQEQEGTASAQADQSYCLGRVKPIPNLSIEVVFTSGGANKLRRYQALGVAEVWFWQDGVLKLYHLESDGYKQIDRSRLEDLQNLDLDLLQRCILMGETDLREAVRVFQQAMRDR